MVGEESVGSNVNSSEEQVAGELYEVECIVDAKLFENGEWRYFVKWKDYSHHYNTWESARSFTSREMIDEFWMERRRIALGSFAWERGWS
uniref:Chromo domain-containing protein n=1 Tax=Strongyloides papillosus TaxID=174720 RepID=A0A0N5BPK1_STREA